ncbi:hypothetical protein ACWV26_11395 [Rummeliibacillus sp. JY-2-4R]
MINELFYNKHKKILPIVLTDCLLFVGLKYYELNKTYIFLKEERVGVSEVGDLWLKGHKKSDLSYKGFFSSNNSFELINLDDPVEVVSIIGYDKNKRYQLLDVSIGNSTFNFNGNFAAKFRFYEYRVSKI